LNLHPISTSAWRLTGNSIFDGCSLLITSTFKYHSIPFGLYIINDDSAVHYNHCVCELHAQSSSVHCTVFIFSGKCSFKLSKLDLCMIHTWIYLSPPMGNDRPPLTCRSTVYTLLVEVCPSWYLQHLDTPKICKQLKPKLQCK